MSATIHTGGGMANHLRKSLILKSHSVTDSQWSADKLVCGVDGSPEHTSSG